MPGLSSDVSWDNCLAYDGSSARLEGGMSGSFPPSCLLVLKDCCWPRIFLSAWLGLPPSFAFWELIGKGNLGVLHPERGAQINHRARSEQMETSC